MEKDEMNYMLRQHSLGQNKGRYDYLFNFIKRLTLPKSQQALLLKRATETGDKVSHACESCFLGPPSVPFCSQRCHTCILQELLAAYRQILLPDNAHTPMATSFLEAYSNHTSQVNLKRGFDSVGGMVTSIPTGNPEIDGKAHQKIRKDKTDEAWKGDAGGWSGHPAFSPYVREPFDIVRGIHRGFRFLATKLGLRDRLISAINAVGDGKAGEDRLASLMELIQEATATCGTAKEVQLLESLSANLTKSLTLHVAQNPAMYQDGLLRFVGE